MRSIGKFNLKINVAVESCEVSESNKTWDKYKIKRRYVF